MLTPTGVTSSAYWDAIKAGNPTHVRIVFTGQNIVLDDQDIDISGGLTITDILNGDTDVVIGRAVCKQVSILLLNSSRLSGLNWTGEFVLEMGVDIGTPSTTRWVQIGIFSGEKPKNITTSRTIQFIAYDRMTKFDVLVDKFFSSITYPKTVKQIYDGLCSYVGVTNVSGNELLNIQSRSYASAPVDMKGYTCRDLLAWIAEAFGCYAKIDANGKCKMVWFASASHTVSENEEFNLEYGDTQAYAIDQIHVKQLNSDVDINYPNDNGSNVYMIVENPFLSVSAASDTTNYIKPIYDRLSAFGNYLPINVECIGCWLVETGDVISVGANGSTVAMPLFTRSLKWNGATNDHYEVTGNKTRDAYAKDEDKQRVITQKVIKLYVEDNYYHTQSGIEITADGVTISGNKYVLIEATNNYRWIFNNIGLSLGLTGQEYYGMKFWIGQNSDDDQTTFVRNTMTGIGFHKNITYSAEDSYYELSFISAMEYSENGQTYHLYNNLQWGGSPLGHWALRPDGHGTADIGEPDNYFGDGYIARICGCGGYKRVDIIPDKQNDTQTRLRVTVDNDHLNVFKQGTSAKTLLMTGDVCGGMIGKTSSVSDLNSLTTPGHYWLTIDSNVANKPSAISSQYCEVIVTRTPVSSWTDVHQVILANDGGIYYRVGWAGSSFNAWKKVTTT